MLSTLMIFPYIIRWCFREEFLRKSVERIKDKCTDVEQLKMPQKSEGLAKVRPYLLDKVK